VAPEKPPNEFGMARRANRQKDRELKRNLFASDTCLLARCWSLLHVLLRQSFPSRNLRHRFFFSETTSGSWIPHGGIAGYRVLARFASSGAGVAGLKQPAIYLAAEDVLLRYASSSALLSYVRIAATRWDSYTRAWSLMFGYSGPDAFI